MILTSVVILVISETLESVVKATVTNFVTAASVETLTSVISLRSVLTIISK